MVTSITEVSLLADNIWFDSLSYAAFLYKSFINLWSLCIVIPPLEQFFSNHKINIFDLTFGDTVFPVYTITFFYTFASTERSAEYGASFINVNGASHALE